MPPPKAISQGSNGAGGGAFTAFTGISAARAEPDTIASAVANKASFFMTIPITLLDSPVPGPPGASDNRLRPNVLTQSQSGLPCDDREAKKASICRLFRRSDHFNKCCQGVLHSHNNFAGFRVTGTVSGIGKAAAATDRRKPFLRISFSVKT